MKKWILGSVLMGLSLSLHANVIENIGDVTYFQTPTRGVVFDYADVYMMQDAEYATSIGGMNTDDWKRTDMVMNKLVDSEGRFSVWKFIPSYIQHDRKERKRLVVEIWFYNEPLKVDTALISVNDEGQYNIPYKVRYRYKLSYSDGSLMYQKDYGVVHGTYPTTNVDFTDEFPVDDRVGIQAAFMRVRQEVYAMYGFGSFEMPFGLYDFSSIQGIDVLQKQIIEAMDQKEEFKLTDKTKSVMAAYADLLAYHLRKLPVEQQPYAHRNLALAKAWLGDTLAVDHLSTYEASLQSVADSMDYYGIDLFVKYYPNGINKYNKLLRLLSGNLHWMVDAFTYNDLLCNVYEIEYPLQILPLLPLNGNVKRVDGQVIQDNKEPLYFKLKYDKKGRLKSVDMNREEYNDKQKVNVRINTLHVSYKKDEYDRITCSPSEFIRILMPGIEDLNKPIDKIEQVMHCKTDNVLGGFVKLKVETEETNYVSLGIDGKVYIRGEKSLSRPHAALKSMADANGEKFPALVSSNSSAYNMEVEFDDNALIQSYNWNGYVLMEKNVGYDNYAFIKADSVAMQVSTIVPYTQTEEGLMNHDVSLTVQNQFVKNRETLKSQKPSYSMSNQWPIAVKFDDYGNWVYLKVGPYDVKRTITYQ